MKQETSRTKVHRVVLMVVDHDDLGAAAVCAEIESVRYPNRCVSPRVASVETREVEWNDDHPLNFRVTQWREFARLFVMREGG